MAYPYLGTEGKHLNKYLSYKPYYVSPQWPKLQVLGCEILLDLFSFSFCGWNSQWNKVHLILFFDQSLIINKTLIQKYEGFTL